jgi:hypothetical protein
MRKPSTKRTLAAPPPGYAFGGSSALVVPNPRRPVTNPVEPSKIRRGLSEAKRQLDETLQSILDSFGGPYEITEIKVIASFSADGKFLGFGVGGAASMEITICPCQE